MIWIVALTLLAVVLVAQYRKLVRKCAFAKDVPVLFPPYPLLGNGLMLLNKTEEQRFWNLRKMTSNRHRLSKFFLGTRMILATSDPEIAQHILNDPVWMDKPFFYEFFDLPYGLLTAKYDIWKIHRKALSPAFSMRILRSFISIFEKYSQKMVDKLATLPDGSTVNIGDPVTTASLEIVLKTTFGADCSEFDGYDAVGPKIERYFYLLSKRILNVVHYVDFFYRLSADGRENRELRKYLDGWADLLLKTVVNRISTESTDENENLRKPKIFIEELYNNNIVKFSQKEITDEAFTMVGGGTDTSSNTAAYTLLSLAMYPHVQQKVYDEVMQVFPTAETEITPEALKHLEYTEMVIKEASRLFPIGPTIVRQSRADSTVAGLHVPKGNILAIDIFNMHRRKDIYGEDADVFDPERFSEERSKDRNPYAFLSFSGGPRGCIGMRYGLMSVKTMIIYMVKNFHMKTKLRLEDLRFKCDVMLRLQDGHLIQLEKRKNSRT